MIAGRCSGVTSSAVSGDGGARSRSIPESCLTRTCRMRSWSIAGAVTMSTIDFLSSPRSRNTRWSPNWRLPSTRQTLRPSSRCSAMAALLALGGEHDDRDVGGGSLLRPDLRCHLVAVELGQHDVEQDEVRRLLVPEPE